jgi:hypothetical protein
VRYMMGTHNSNRAEEHVPILRVEPRSDQSLFGSAWAQGKPTQCLAFHITFLMINPPAPRLMNTRGRSLVCSSFRSW